MFRLPCSMGKRGPIDVFYQSILINNTKRCSIGTDYWDYLFSVVPIFLVMFSV